MQTPVRINLHQLPASPALEARIQASVAELETFFDRIVSCHVSVGVPQGHHRQGQLFHVGIEIGLPGERSWSGGRRTRIRRTQIRSSPCTMRSRWRAAASKTTRPPARAREGGKGDRKMKVADVMTKDVATC